MTVENSVGPFPSHQLILVFANKYRWCRKQNMDCTDLGKPNKWRLDKWVLWLWCIKAFVWGWQWQNCNVRKILRIRLCIFFSKLTGNREGEGHSWKKKESWLQTKKNLSLFGDQRDWAKILWQTLFFRHFHPDPIDWGTTTSNAGTAATTVEKYFVFTTNCSNGQICLSKRCSNNLHSCCPARSNVGWSLAGDALSAASNKQTKKKKYKKTSKCLINSEIPGFGRKRLPYRR